MSDAQVKIRLTKRPGLYSPVMTLDFNVRLHRRGSDATFYANSGYAEDARDTDLMVSIMRVLGSQPIEQIIVTPYSLRTKISLAADYNEIVSDIVRYADAVSSIGVDYVDLTERAGETDSSGPPGDAPVQA